MVYINLGGKSDSCNKFTDGLITMFRLFKKKEKDEQHYFIWENISYGFLKVKFMLDKIIKVCQ